MTGSDDPARTALVWLGERTWQASIDAARQLPAATRVTLVHVTDDDPPDAAHGAFLGLLGRGGPGHDPGTRIERYALQSAAGLLEAAARRLGRPCARVERHGRTEREVVAEAADADLLIVARDGDLSRLGPRSLGKEARFVVDHAPCQVLLVWPGAAPGVGTIPSPKERGPKEKPPKEKGPRPDRPHRP